MSIEGPRLGPFALERVLDSGGMGSVWRGVHVAQGIPVACKVITAEKARDPRSQDAFRREVRNVAALDHPAIVMVFDAGEVDLAAERASNSVLAAGSPYLVMELLDRGSLRRAPPPREWQPLRRMILEMLDALAHSHARGVVHRDIKPGNVLLGDPDAGPSVKLTDFGIAHALDEQRVSVTYEATGTPHYMAPEQIYGALRELGPWTDLYALGCLIHTLASGRPPFWGRSLSVDEVLRRQATAPVPPLVSRVPVPRGFDAWLGWLLAKSPAMRCRCAADAAEALLGLGDPSDDRVANDDAIEPDDEGPTRSARRPVNRVADGDATIVTGPPTSLGRDESHAEPASWRAATCPRDWRTSLAPPRSAALLGAGLGLFGVRAVPLVGREHERDALWTGLHRAIGSDRPHAVLVRGTTGVGKSGLARWFTMRAQEVGAIGVVRVTHAPHLGAGDGLANGLRRFARCTGATRDETREALLADVLARGGTRNDALAMLEVLHPTTDGNDTATERVRLGTPAERDRAIARYLDFASSERPVCLFVDDAQWGTDALLFVQHLLDANATSHPILALVTIQDDAADVPSENADRISAIARHEAAESLQLGPLDDDAHRALVTQLLGLTGDLASKVARRTAGHPLFAIQLVGDWVQRGVLEVVAEGFALRTGEAAEIPDGIHEVWSRRLQSVEMRLGDGSAAREALEIAATLGTMVAADEWSRACVAASIAIPARLADAMIDGGLAQQNERGWSFAHELLRESLERGAREAGRSRRAHRACADAVRGAWERGDLDAGERLARHCVESGDPEGALEPLFECAQRRGQRSDYRAALALLERRDALFDTAGLDPDDTRRARGWIAWARWLARLGRPADADSVLDRVDSWKARTEVHALDADLLHGRAYDAQFAGRLVDAIAQFTSARVLYERDGDVLGLARCDHGLGELLRQSARTPEAIPHFEAALAGYAAIGDRIAYGNGLLGLSGAYNGLGDSTRASEVLGEARQVMTLAGHRLGLAIVELTDGQIETIRSNLDVAIDRYREAARLLDEIGSTDVAVARGNLAMLLIRRDRWSEARSLLESNVAMWDAAGRAAYSVFAHAPLMACCAAQRTWDDFDLHASATERTAAASGLVDEDIALSAERAAELAEAAGESARAERARVIARDQRSRGA